MESHKNRVKTKKQEPYKNKIFPTAKLVVVTALFLFLIGGYVFYRWYSRQHRQQALLATVSQLDVAGVEPQVVQKIQRLTGEVRKHSRFAQAWGKLAMNLDVHDYKNESISIYKEAALLDPSDLRWPYFCAMVLAESGSQESLEWFERAREIKPDYTPLLVNYGNALLRNGKTNEAKQKYDQVLSIEPKNSHALLGLARISLAQGMVKESRAYLSTAIEANAVHRAVYELLSTICKQQKDLSCVDRADVIADRMPEKTPLVDPIYAELSQEGESSLWYRFRGSEFMKNGMPDRAVAEFRHAIQLRPDPQTTEDLAKALNAAGKYSEAAQQYRSVLARHPTADNYFGIAMAQARMGSYDEAESFFRQALQRKPEFAEAYFNLAVLYARRRQLEQTIENLGHAIRIRPDYAEAHYHLGLAYIAAGDQVSAMKQFETLTKIDPKLAERLSVSIQTGSTNPTE
jgi:tetratricopeptide (TPR) repeat protein